MMMVPEPWHKNENMESKKRAFYEYHSLLMEPWDGPAAIVFTDGVIMGASLIEMVFVLQGIILQKMICSYFQVKQGL